MHEKQNSLQLSGYTQDSSLITQLVSIFCDLVELPRKMGERYSAVALGGALVLVLATAAQGGIPMTGITGSVVVTAACGGSRRFWMTELLVVLAAGSSNLPTSARVFAPLRAGLFYGGDDPCKKVISDTTLQCTPYGLSASSSVGHISEMARENETCYYTEYGSCYHSRPGCPALSNSSAVYETTVGEAEYWGLERCDRCY